MYCPECQAEYRDGFTECAKCNVPLVENLPEEEGEPEFADLVTVYKTSNPSIIAVAKSILESEGIVHYVKGEGLQDLFALGRLGTGFNPVIGEAEIQVDKNDSEYVKKLFEKIDESDSDEPEYEKADEDAATVPEGTGVYSFIKGLVVGLLISAVAFGVYDWRRNHHSGTDKYDLNNDNRFDAFYHYEKGKLVESERDLNFDGEIDEIGIYQNGILDRSKTDSDFDGEIDAWGYYKNGLLTHEYVDFNNDKERDLIEHYENGIFTKREWLNNSQNVIYKMARYRFGVKREEYVDQDLDGQFDIKNEYDSMENIVSTKKLH